MSAYVSRYCKTHGEWDMDVDNPGDCPECADYKEQPSPFVSPNHSPRRGGPGDVRLIVIHDTASATAQSALNWFGRLESRVSAHVVIDRDGTIYRVVPDERAAWHAGRSAYGTIGDVNACSLGVELVDVDDAAGMTYTVPQLEAAAAWVARKCRDYLVPLNRIVGHDAIALPAGRKGDPGADFPWYSWLRDVAAML